MMLTFSTADVFKANPNLIGDEKAYESIKIGILGAESSEDEEGSDNEGGEESDEDQGEIRDKTETNLRRTIYLTIMSSIDFEEDGHKLMEIKLDPGQEVSTTV